MPMDKGLITGSTTMLVLKLLESKDMYGYQMIEELARKSNDTFSLKAGTLYPLLHGLENEKMVESYESCAENGRERKYYTITKKGKKLLNQKMKEWAVYTNAVDGVLKGDVAYAGM